MKKLSEIPQYLEYGRALVDKDYQKARENLLQCIEMARKDSDAGNEALLLTFLGDLTAREGQPDIGLRHYEKAESLDPTFPMIKIKAAKFIAQHLDQADKVEAKLRDAEALINSPDWPPPDGDLSKGEYQRRIDEVKEIIRSA